jgi:transcriptional regulator with XRE-family HTH domain
MVERRRTSASSGGRQSTRLAPATPLAAAPEIAEDDDGSAASELESALPVIEEQLGWVIANHVRSRRQAIGQSVGQLAARSGISKGMLSKIENAQASPSLSTLARLASALDMPLTSLFRGLAEERDAVFVKAGSGPEIVRQGTRAGHRYQLLGSLRGPEHKVEPLLVALTERTEVFPLFQHSGVELLYMLEGVMGYGYGTQRYRMEPGDTLQFEGDIAHGPVELIELPIRFLSITVYP